MELNINLLPIISFLMLLNYAQATPPTAALFARSLTRRLLIDDPSTGQKAELPDTNSAVAVLGTTTYNPALKKICGTTDYVSLCLSSITPFLNGKTDTVTVLQMLIKASIEQTNKAISVCEKLAKASDTPPETASALSDCLENYTDALDNFQSAQDAIPDKDTGTIDTMLSAAVTDYTTCEDQIGGSDPITRNNEKLSNMASNCLAIASLIK